MTQVDASTNSSVPLSHGLTGLHLAVLANDYAKVRKIVGDGEIGIDVPTATGTTALMLAALYGRSNIFFFLAGYNASSTMKDSYQYSARHYVDPQSPFLKDLIREYNTIASSEPDRAGRRHISRELKARRHERKEAYDLGRARGRAEAQAQAKSRDQAQIQLQTSANMDHLNIQQPSKDSSLHLVFLRSLDGKLQVVMEGRQVAIAEHGTIGRKCTGFIYAGDENDSYKFAISGWGRAIQDKNAVFRNVLNSREYTELAMRVAALFDFELKSSNYDLFLKMLTQKTGLIFRCQSHDWYTYGKRSKLRPLPNGSCEQVTEATKGSGLDDDEDIFEDEIGIFDSDDIMETNLQGIFEDHEGKSLMARDDPVTSATPSNARPVIMRQQVLREPVYFEKRGSPVDEEPKHVDPGYYKPNVTPTSKKAQALPTPESHTRLTEIPRITVSSVEDILQSREEDGVRLFLVKWKGYPPDNNTWEPERNLINASDAINKFWEELRAAESNDG
ncbi:Chromatin organization modifier domain [Diaporthe eres]|uniref:Chromatin organization modifier domain n=1 Tax=Diaporthe eres TaxID=83184 RepID=A0ABR1PDG7_DIAER